jgi:hypothetical protein
MYSPVSLEHADACCPRVSRCTPCESISRLSLEDSDVVTVVSLPTSLSRLLADQLWKVVAVGLSQVL